MNRNEALDSCWGSILKAGTVCFRGEHNKYLLDLLLYPMICLSGAKERTQYWNLQIPTENIPIWGFQWLVDKVPSCARWTELDWPSLLFDWYSRVRAVPCGVQIAGRHIGSGHVSISSGPHACGVSVPFYLWALRVGSYLSEGRRPSAHPSAGTVMCPLDMHLEFFVHRKHLNNAHAF